MLDQKINTLIKMTGIQEETWKEKFLRQCLNDQVLQVGEFTLKSGRISPYFFNAGSVSDGEFLNNLGEAYASALKNAGIAFDVLFGPAYKGIPIVAATSIAYSHKYNLKVPYVYNRKEIKKHGEGGEIVGASDLLNSGARVVIVDDVLTAGTAIGEIFELLKHYKCEVVACIVSFDRQEVVEVPIDGEPRVSALQSISKKYGISIVSILTFSDLFSYVTKRIDEYRGCGNDKDADRYMETLQLMKSYRQRYGAF